VRANLYGVNGRLLAFPFATAVGTTPMRARRDRHGGRQRALRATGRAKIYSVSNQYPAPTLQTARDEFDSTPIFADGEHL